MVSGHQTNRERYFETEETDDTSVDIDELVKRALSGGGGKLIGRSYTIRAASLFLGHSLFCYGPCGGFTCTDQGDLQWIRANLGHR